MFVRRRPCRYVVGVGCVLCVYLISIYLSINVALYYPSEWTRLKSRNTPERGRGMSGHAAGTLWVSNPRIESPCVAERRRSVGGPHVGRFSLAWWWLRAPRSDPILRPRMVPYRVSNPSRRTSGRSARAPSRATNHTLYLSIYLYFSPRGSADQVFHGKTKVGEHLAITV